MGQTSHHTEGLSDLPGPGNGSRPDIPDSPLPPSSRPAIGKLLWTSHPLVVNLVSSSPAGILIPKPSHLAGVVLCNLCLTLKMSLMCALNITQPPVSSHICRYVTLKCTVSVQ